MTLLLFYNGIDTREKDAPTIELAGLSYQRGVLIRFAPTILFGLLFFIIRVKVIMTSKFKVYKQIPVFEQVGGFINLDPETLNPKSGVKSDVTAHGDPRSVTRSELRSTIPGPYTLNPESGVEGLHQTPNPEP